MLPLNSARYEHRALQFTSDFIPRTVEFLRGSYSGSTPAFHAGNEGSNPSSRSEDKE